VWRAIESYGDLERVVGAPALQNRWATVGLALVTGSWVAAETFPLRDALFYAATFNREYSRAELEEPIRIVGGIEKEESPAARGLLSAPVLALVRKHGPRRSTVLPTSRVCGPISVSIHPTSYFSSTPTANFPFLKDFAGPVPPDGFQLLYRKDTPANGRLELYRVLPNAIAAAARSTP